MFELNRGVDMNRAVCAARLLCLPIVILLLGCQDGMTPRDAWNPGGVGYLQIKLKDNEKNPSAQILVNRLYCGSVQDSEVCKLDPGVYGLALRTSGDGLSPMGYFDTTVTVAAKETTRVETRLRPYVVDSILSVRVDGLCVRGSRAFLVTEEGPVAVSIDDPEEPRLLPDLGLELPDGDTLRKLVFGGTGTRAYAITSRRTNYFVRAFVYDSVSDTFRLLASGVPEIDLGAPNVLRDVCACDSFVYTVDDQGYLFKMRLMANSLEQVRFAEVMDPTKVRTGTRAAYVLGKAPSGRGGLYAVALPDFDEVHMEEGLGPANGLYLTSNFAYVAHGLSRGQSALRIASLEDPLNPLYVGSVLLRDARDVTMHDTLAFVADGDYGLAVVSAKNAYRPLVTGRCTDIRATHTAVAVSGAYAYLATDVGLVVYRVR